MGMAGLGGTVGLGGGVEWSRPGNYSSCVSISHSMKRTKHCLVAALLFGASCDFSSDLTDPAIGGPSSQLSCDIPVDQIFSGGVGRDEIPALVTPDLGSPGATPAGLLDGDRVLGVVLNGAARAYPFPVMWWHEVVNDTLGGEPILVTYCPLTGTGIAFNRRVGGQTREFGVSGLLYRTNLIMFDRETESLWNQMLLGSQCGVERGNGMARVPVMETTLAHWKRIHPTTTVMTTNTGFDRNYSTYPYGNYRSLGNEQVAFLAEGVTWSMVRPAKEVVLGVIDGWVPGQDCRTFFECHSVAYPFGVLRDSGTVVALNDSVGTRAILVTYQHEYLAARAFDRTVNGDLLTFEILTQSPMTLRDRETETTWDENGVAVAGTLAGQRLTAIADSYVGFWFAWSLYFRNLVLFE